MHKICILDYGLGNIKSLQNALKKIGYEVNYFSNDEKKKYDLIFIPGVGSFSKASNILLKKKYTNFLNNVNSETKIFGICLGMQIFSTTGYENGTSKGLNYIEGKTEKIKKNNNKLILPFVGYLKVNFSTNKQNLILNKFNNQKFYFVHSYHLKPKKSVDILATTEFQDFKFCSSIKNDRYIGTQFHPEKSGDIGLEFLDTIIKNFV